MAARRRYGWGAKKLRQRLRHQAPEVAWPARSTINEILDRHGLLRKQRRSEAWTHHGSVTLASAAENDVWRADFKGQLKTGDGRYRYALTVTDHFSRRDQACRGWETITVADTRADYRELYRASGLPLVIRTENGMPFAGPGLQGLASIECVGAATRDRAPADSEPRAPAST